MTIDARLHEERMARRRAAHPGPNIDLRCDFQCGQGCWPDDEPESTFTARTLRDVASRGLSLFTGRSDDVLDELRRGRPK